MKQRRISLSFLTAGAMVLGIAACGDATDPSLLSGKQNAQTLAECDGGTATSPSLTPHTIAIWPPNHKLHDISIDDCVTVTPACDADIHAEFVWASSDEPVDDIGDGHHEPDIVVSDCGHVQVRAERQGPKDGRVYKLGVRLVDRDGNTAESTCTIVVDHDQRGAEGADSGESYRISLDGTNDLPFCDGTQPEEPSDGSESDADDGTDTDDDATGGAEGAGSDAGTGSEGAGSDTGTGTGAGGGEEPPQEVVI